MIYEYKPYSNVKWNNRLTKTQLPAVDFIETPSQIMNKRKMMPGRKTKGDFSFILDLIFFFLLLEETDEPNLRVRY